MMDTIHGTWNDSPDAVTLIDAHHHLWDLSQRKHPNLIGEPRHDFFMGDDSALRRDYLPEDYKRDAAGHNVLTTVHCEAEWDRADQIGETRWITQIHAEYGFPGAIVAHAWFDTDNAEEVIAAQAAFPLVRGIRSKPVTAVLARQDRTRRARHDAGRPLAARLCAARKIRAVVGFAGAVLASGRGRRGGARLSGHRDRAEPHRVSVGPQRGGSESLAPRHGSPRARTERACEGVGIRAQGSGMGV